LRAQDFVSKGDYESAFLILNEISIYSQFYTQAQSLGKQINDFIFNQKELQKKKLWNLNKNYKKHKLRYNKSTMSYKKLIFKLILKLLIKK
jgi:hypothetical protein